MDDLESRFQVITISDPDNAAKLARVRQLALELAMTIDELADDSREKSAAITKLEEATFWANRAIARTVGVV
jgi:hypothetical protein